MRVYALKCLILECFRSEITEKSKVLSQSPTIHFLLGTVQKLRNLLRGRGGGHQKITKDYNGGRVGTPKDHIGLLA